MNRLEENHLTFLRTCATKPNSIHALPTDVTGVDADAMATEGLLVKYNKPTGRFYAIGRYGAQYIKELTSSEPSEEMRKLAVAYVMTKDYSEADAETIVVQNGVENILASQADELRQNTQREVKVPLNEQGKAEIKFRG